MHYNGNRMQIPKEVRQAHFARLIEKFRTLVEERIQPGDDLLWQTIYRTVIHPSELALWGWTYSRVRESGSTPQ